MQKWFFNLKIMAKILTGNVFVVLVSLVVALTAYSYLSKFSNNTEDLYYNSVVPIQDLGTAYSDLIAIRGDIRLMLLETTNEGKEKWLKSIKKEAKEIDQLLDDYSKTNLLKSEEDTLSLFKSAWTGYLEQVLKASDLIFQEKNQEAIVLLDTKARDYLNICRPTLKALVAINVNAGNKAHLETEGDVKKASLMLIILVITGTAGAFTLSYLIAKVIKKELNKVLNMANEMIKGHIKVRANVQTNDELGEMGRVLDNFAHLVDENICGVLNKIASGDVSYVSKASDKDDEIAPVLNKLTSTVRELISETSRLTEAAVEGRLSVRGSEEKFSGGFREIVHGVNATLDAVILPVKEGSDVLEVMAKGDLTVRVKGNYKGDHQIIKNSINQLAEEMNYALREVNEAVHATASAATEISSSSEEMAAGSQEQSQQTTEVASAVEELSKMIYETSKGASTVAETLKGAEKRAIEGGKVVDKTIEGMNQIEVVVTKASSTIEALGESSNQIGEIIQVIDDIADQTNLLALNAAIEAARAGEQGRGFAVVADEVRKLAERTIKATKEIAQMISKIQSDTILAVEAIREGNEEVEKGKAYAYSSGEALKEIIDDVNKSSSLSHQAVSATEEMSSGADQISKSMEGISSVTQQSAAGTEQIARAAEDLNRLTVNLQELISRFRLGDESERSSSSAGRLTQSGGFAVRSNGRLTRR
ncbi:MAG: methyl-accepting chemotaxis protein [Bacillota bacterium]